MAPSSAFVVASAPPRSWSILASSSSAAPRRGTSPHKERNATTASDSAFDEPPAAKLELVPRSSPRPRMPRGSLLLTLVSAVENALTAPAATLLSCDVAPAATLVSCES